MECVYNADGIRYESSIFSLHNEKNKSELDEKKIDIPIFIKAHNYNILKKESNIDEIKKLLLNYSC